MKGCVHYIRALDGVKLGLQDLGGSGPSLLILHANGFLGMAYQPMVEAGLSRQFHCYALDFRGHGASAHAGLQPPKDIVLGKKGVRRREQEPHAETQRHLDTHIDDVLTCCSWLRKSSGSGSPLFVFGHSLGGLMALAAEIRRPGTCAAVFLFEPVVYSQDMRSPGVAQALSEMAIKRRNRFESKVAALASYSSKPPFSAFDSHSLELYIEHGMRTLPGGGVTLVCEPATVESWIYLMIRSLSEHVYEQLPHVRCPVTMACGGVSGSINDFMAEVLPVAAERLPRCRLARYNNLHHFGPFEDPSRLAEDVAAEFAADASSRDSDTALPAEKYAAPQSKL